MKTFAVTCLQIFWKYIPVSRESADVLDLPTTAFGNDDCDVDELRSRKKKKKKEAAKKLKKDAKKSKKRAKKLASA